MATMDDIARQTGVSKGTVSRALRQDPTLSITEETRDRIFKAAEELGYHLKKERLLSYTCNLAVIHKESHFLNQIDNAFYFSVRYGIEMMCHEKRVQFTFIPYNLLERQPISYDGLIMIGGYTKEQMQYVRDLAKTIPCVHVGKCNYCPNDFDCVSSDVRDSVYQAMDALNEAGEKKILYLGGQDIDGIGEEYRKSHFFTKYITEHEHMSCAGIVEGSHGSESGYCMMKNWLNNHDVLPDGIFVSNDPIAIGAIRALNENGIAVPGDVSVIGLNGDTPGEMTSPPLATVDVHTMEMGKEAVKLLMERIETKSSIRKKIMFQATLIRRKSIKG